MKRFNVFASTYQGLEEILKKEIDTLLNVEDSEIRRRGVALANRPLTDIYKMNFYLRTALRVFLELDRFELSQASNLYDRAKEIEWEKWFGLDQTFKIDASANNSEFFDNAIYASQLLKDAICDRYREKSGERPSVNIDHPDILIHLQISSESCTISLNSSGESLHKRGYKTQQTPAPLSEVLAAGIIKLSGWNGNTPLLDPMCGSGTFLAEAFMISEEMAAQKFRQWFAFKSWIPYNKEDFSAIKHKSILGSKKAYIEGSDMHPLSVKAAEENLSNMYKGRNPNVSQQDFFKLEKPFPKGIIFMNPPYDVRMEKENINEFYAKIGDHLKKNFEGWDAWIFSSNISALKSVGLKPNIRIPLFNGPLEARLMHFQLYKGSKRPRIQATKND